MERKRFLTEGMDIRQRVRKFMGSVAFNLPRAALRYLKADADDELVVKAVGNHIEISLGTKIQLSTPSIYPVAVDATISELNKYIPQIAIHPRPTHGRIIRIRRRRR